MEIQKGITQKQPRLFPLSGLSVVLVLLLFVRYWLLLIVGVNIAATILFWGVYAMIAGIGAINYVFGKFDSPKVFAFFGVVAICFFLLLNDRFGAAQGALALCLSLLMFSLLTNESDIDKIQTVYRTLLIITAVVTIVCMFIPHNTIDDTLTFYTDNGNQSGLLLLCFVINLFVFRCQAVTKRARFGYDLLMLGLAYGCIQTGSRTVWVALILLVALRLLSKLPIRVLKIIITVLLIASIVLPLLFSLSMELFGRDATLFGQTIYTGREVLWSNGIKEIFGDVFAIHIGQDLPTTGMPYYGDEGLNAHNVFLEIAWRFSVFTAVIIVALFYKLVRHIMRTASEPTLRIILPVLGAVLLHMAFESSLFVGAVDYSVLTLFPLIILVNKDRRKQNEG